MRVDQLKAAAAFVGPFAPPSAGAVSDFVHVDVNRVGDDEALFIGDDDLIGHGQRDAFAFGEIAAEIAQGVGASQRDVIGQQMGGILGHDQVRVSAQHGVGGKGEINAVAEQPTAEVHRGGSLVVEFDVLVVVVAGNRRVHDFVDDHIGYQDIAVGRARGARLQPVKFVRAIGIAAGGNAVLLSAELHGIEHASAVGVFEVNRFAGGAQGEAHLRLVEDNEAPRLNPGVGGDDEFVCVRVVRENAR